jgi:hypothetical protein
VFGRIDDRQDRRAFVLYTIWNNLDEEDQIWVKTELGGANWFLEHERKNRA